MTTTIIHQLTEPQGRAWARSIPTVETGCDGRTEYLPILRGKAVERPTPDQRSEAPDRPADFLEVAAGGGPATIHHANLGLITGFLALEGVYLLPSGDVAAVYNAEAIPIG